MTHDNAMTYIRYFLAKYNVLYIIDVNMHLRTIKDSKSLHIQIVGMQAELANLHTRPVGSCIYI